jgi:hypothetical protein
MATVYSRWQLKPGASRQKLGDLALEMCRAARANEGVRSARYYWADANTITVLTDFENPSRIFANPPTPEGTKRGFALADMAERLTWEVWSSAGEGTNANQLSKS